MQSETKPTGNRRVEPDPARIRVETFGAYSLDVNVFAVLAGDWSEYLEIAEELNLRIMDIVAAAGTGFAFPSQTTSLESGSGMDVARASNAEEQVARWRERHAPYVPRFPKDVIDRIDDSIASPPAGSAAAGVEGVQFVMRTAVCRRQRSRRRVRSGWISRGGGGERGLARTMLGSSIRRLESMVPIEVAIATPMTMGAVLGPLAPLLVLAVFVGLGVLLTRVARADWAARRDRRALDAPRWRETPRHTAPAR